MAETVEGVSFPIVFHDGERDTNIGSVIVSSSTEFKNFQSLLSKMIGISSHQFTVYLAEYKISLDSSTKIRRRIPITGKVNFSAISGEKNSFFSCGFETIKTREEAKGRPRQRRRILPLVGDEDENKDESIKEESTGECDAVETKHRHRKGIALRLHLAGDGSIRIRRANSEAAVGEGEVLNEHTAKQSDDGRRRRWRPERFCEIGNDSLP